MKGILTLVFAVMAFASCLGQISNTPCDTINERIIGNYKSMVQAGYQDFVDSIDLVYLNRSKVEFENLSNEERDDLVSKEFSLFFTEFKDNFANFEPTQKLKKGKYNFYVNFYIGESGQVKYVFYNWSTEAITEEVDEYFRQFLANYHFTQMPIGTVYSQCASAGFRIRKS